MPVVKTHILVLHTSSLGVRGREGEPETEPGATASFILIWKGSGPSQTTIREEGFLAGDSQQGGFMNG